MVSLEVWKVRSVREPVGVGTRDGKAVELALELREDQGHSLSGTGLGGDHVEGSGAGTTQILVRSILQTLITGVGVDGSHDAALDTEGVIEDFGKRSEAVGGARSVRDDVVLRVVVVAIVDAHDEGAVDVLAGSGDDDLLGAGLKVGLGLLAISEESSGLDDDFGAELLPGQVSGVALGENLDGLAVNGDGVIVVADLTGRNDP